MNAVLSSENKIKTYRHTDKAKHLRTLLIMSQTIKLLSSFAGRQLKDYLGGKIGNGRLLDFLSEFDRSDRSVFA